MSGFFSYFPSLLYGNTAVTNIIAKIKFDQSVTTNYATFYPYTIEEGERADTIAENYYGESTYDWVIYLSNGIVDPLHEWPKSSDVFDQYIKTKYGSIANAQNQVAFYRVNYDQDDSVLSTAAYSALGTKQKQFWSPILGYNEKVINYQRKEIDLVVETNKVISLSGSFGGLVENDILKQSATVTGTVGFANTTNVVLKHVTGTWANSTSVYYVGSNSLANATITSVTTLDQPLDTTVLSYWTSVSKYEEESELNEKRKVINLLDAAYLDVVERDMRELLSL